MSSSNDSIDFIQFLDVLYTTVTEKTGRVLAQIGSITGRTVDGVNAEWWSHVGFISRPGKPVSGKVSAKCIALRRGSTDAIIASEDLRGNALKGNLDNGEACAYAGGPEGTGQARTLWKKDGSVTQYTTDDNTDAGKSVYFRTAIDGFQWVAPWGVMKWDATGFHLVHQSGASFDLGGIGGMPPPLDQFGSYIKLQAAALSVQTAGQALGVGTPVPLALEPQVAAAITGLQTQITALSLALKALQADPTHVASATAAAAAVSAEATGAIATGTALATMAATTGST